MRRGLGSFVLAAAAWAWAWAIGACSGETSFYLPPIDAGTVDTQFAAACAAWATAVCTRETRCQGSDPVLWTTVDQCLDRSKLLCEVVAADPGVSFDAQKVLTCTYPDDCATTVRDLPLDCLPPGRTPPGGLCVFHEACTSRFCDATGGVCGVCSGSFPPCPCDGDAGLVCASQTPDGGVVCAPVEPLGATCSAQTQCPGAYCAFRTPGRGLCVPLAGIGDSCGDGVNAAVGREGTPCGVPNTYCDSTLHCSVIQGVDYGDMCGTPPDGGPLLVCAGYGLCDPSTNTCIQPAPDGEICDESQGLGCEPPAECIADRCFFPTLAFCEP